MRRTSILQLTLLPVLASARLVHADPDVGQGGPPVTTTPSQDGAAQVYDQNDGPPGETQPSYYEAYNGPNGPVYVVVLPPGMTAPGPAEVPCDMDPTQARCQQAYGEYYYTHGPVWRGGFGGYFAAGGGG
jgi:hypothetical protein